MAATIKKQSRKKNGARKPVGKPSSQAGTGSKVPLLKPPSTHSLGRDFGNFVTLTHQARSREKQLRLFAAGQEVFTKVGYHGARISDIAKKADCSVGSVYRLFSDKDGLFRALQAAIAEHTIHNIDLFFSDKSLKQLSIIEVLEEYVAGMFHITRRQDGFYRALFERGLVDPEVWDPMRRISRYEGKVMTSFLKSRGEHVGPDTQYSIEVGLAVISGAMMRMTSDVNSISLEDIPKTLRVMTRMLASAASLEHLITNNEKPKSKRR